MNETAVETVTDAVPSGITNPKLIAAFAAGAAVAVGTTYAVGKVRKVIALRTALKNTVPTPENFVSSEPDLR